MTYRPKNYKVARFERYICSSSFCKAWQQLICMRMQHEGLLSRNLLTILLTFCESNTLVVCVFYLVFYGPWQEHVGDFWDHRHDRNVLFVFYEDLHQVVNWILSISVLLEKHFTTGLVLIQLYLHTQLFADIALMLLVRLD